jgi:hypothetical protein
MHTYPMRPTEALSAAAPLKVGRGSRSLSVPEGFGVTLKQQTASTGTIDAAANPLESNTVIDQHVSGETAQDDAYSCEKSTGRPLAARESAVSDEARRTAKSMAILRPITPVANQACPDRNGLEQNVTPPVLLSGKAASSKPKDDAKASRHEDAAEAMPPHGDLVSVDTCSAPTVLSDVSAINPNREVAAHSPSGEIDGTAKPVPPALLSAVARQTGGVRGPEAANPVQSNDNGIAADAGKDQADTPEPAVRRGGGAALAKPNPGELDSRAVKLTDRACCIGGSSMSTTGTSCVAVQSPAANHLFVAAARPEVRLESARPTTEILALGPQMIVHAPARLDVGVFDETHGWLRIRAELASGGGVSAMLTASTAAHDSLRAALPEMASYLGSEAVSVARIGLHRFGDDSSSMTAAAGSQQNGGYREEGRSGNSAQDDVRARERASIGIDPNREESTPAVLSGPTLGRVGNLSEFNAGTAGLVFAASGSRGGFAAIGCGGWLSVCA